MSFERPPRPRGSRVDATRGSEPHSLEKALAPVWRESCRTSSQHGTPMHRSSRSKLRKFFSSFVRIGSSDHDRGVWSVRRSDRRRWPRSPQPPSPPSDANAACSSTSSNVRAHVLGQHDARRSPVRHRTLVGGAREWRIPPPGRLAVARVYRRALSHSRARAPSGPTEASNRRSLDWVRVVSSRECCFARFQAIESLWQRACAWGRSRPTRARARSRSALRTRGRTLERSFPPRAVRARRCLARRT